MKNIFKSFKRKQSDLELVNRAKIEDLVDELRELDPKSDEYRDILLQIDFIEDGMKNTKPDKVINSDNAIVIASVIGSVTAVVTTAIAIGYENDGNIIAGTARKAVDRIVSKGL